MKRLLKILLSLLIVITVVVSIYLLYVVTTYYRIDDNQKLEIENNQTGHIELNEEYTLMTYNIGFGAYQQDYSFFMDCGTMLTGEEVCGIYGKGIDEDNVMNNTLSSIDISTEQMLDFYFLQEVDTDSTRSYHINQYEMITDSFEDYSSVYGINFHSAFLAFPLDDFHGASNSGLLTLSRYQVNEAYREGYTVSDDFPDKYMDLDRCVTINRYLLDNDRELVLVNSHMSAYDEGGIIRKKQIEELNEIMKTEYEKGNYVIVGGDFNHDIADSKETFPTQQKTPTWIYDFTDDDLTEGYSIVVAENATEVATCRAAEIPYEEGVNHEAVIDGFIVSDNIEATAVNVDAEYLASDHNPVILSFTLK